MIISTQANERFIMISRNNEYMDYLELNRDYNEFDQLLSDFLLYYTTIAEQKPSHYELKLFIFPEKGYKGPMVDIFYPECFNVVDLLDDFLLELRNFLVKKSIDLNHFKVLRSIQRKYRFRIKRGVHE